MGLGSLFSNVTYFMFLLIMAFLILTNYKGFTVGMKQGGATTVSIVKALQGR